MHGAWPTSPTGLPAIRTILALMQRVAVPFSPRRRSLERRALARWVNRSCAQGEARAGPGAPKPHVTRSRPRPRRHAALGAGSSEAMPRTGKENQDEAFCNTDTNPVPAEYFGAGSARTPRPHGRGVGGGQRGSATRAWRFPRKLCRLRALNASVTDLDVRD